MGSAGCFILVATGGSHTQLWGPPGGQVCQVLGPNLEHGILSRGSQCSNWEGRSPGPPQPCLRPRAQGEHVHPREEAETPPFLALQVHSTRGSERSTKTPGAAQPRRSWVGPEPSPTKALCSPHTCQLGPNGPAAFPGQQRPGPGPRGFSHPGDAPAETAG